MKRMTKVIIAMVMGLVGCVTLSVCGFGATCDDLSDRVLRLHVLAASDSEQDQALKLKVRDAIVQETAGMMDGVYNTALAKEQLSSQLDRIQRIAEACLKENGCDDRVHVELQETYFSTRQYETFTLPAGEYEALRVVIGEGAGKNWWCVVFPPMCLSSAEDITSSDILTDTQCEIVSSPKRYVVRLKLVEWFKEIEQRLQL